MQDFKIRLEASIKAAELGQDEIKAFRDGLQNQDDSKNKTELFNNAFGAQNGLMNMVIGKNRDHSKYYQVLSKVQGIAQGNGAKLTEQDTQLLKEYGSTHSEVAKVFGKKIQKYLIHYYYQIR